MIHTDGRRTIANANAPTDAEREAILGLRPLDTSGHGRLARMEVQPGFGRYVRLYVRNDGVVVARTLDGDTP